MADLTDKELIDWARESLSESRGGDLWGWEDELEALAARLEAVIAERDRWKYESFLACAGIVPTSAVGAVDQVRPEDLRLMRGALSRTLGEAKERAEAAESEAAKLRERVAELETAVSQASSGLTRAGFDWTENNYGLKSQGGRGLFLRTTHIDARLREVLEPAPPQAASDGGEVGE